MSLHGTAELLLAAAVAGLLATATLSMLGQRPPTALIITSAALAALAGVLDIIDRL